MNEERWYCPDCGHDKFHVDSHGLLGEDERAIRRLVCAQCEQRVNVKPSPAHLLPEGEQDD